MPEGILFTIGNIHGGEYDYVIDVDPALKARVNQNVISASVRKDITPAITFTEISKDYGPLTVSKKVVSNLEADQDRAFNFTVTLTNSDGTAAAVSGETEAVDVAPDGTQTPASKMSFSNGIANVAVKGSYEKIIKNLPSSKEYQYKVEEAETNNNAWATTAENASGAITHEGTKASFVNEPKTGALDVTKTIVGVSGKQFAFTVTLYEDEAAARAGNPLNLTEDCGDMQFKDGVASFQLAHGQTSHGTGIPSNVYYAVEEAIEDDWSCTKSGDTEKIVADGLSTAKFVNEFVPKDAKGIDEVRVLKELEGRAWSDDDEFTFELAADSAKDQDGTQIAANEMPMPEGNTTISIDSGSDKDKAEFELADGQSVEIASLPRGAAYEVVETDAGGMAASWAGNTGTIPKNGSAEAYAQTAVRPIPRAQPRRGSRGARPCPEPAMRPPWLHQRPPRQPFCSVQATRSSVAASSEPERIPVVGLPSRVSLCSRATRVVGSLARLSFGSCAREPMRREVTSSSRRAWAAQRKHPLL